MSDWQPGNPLYERPAVPADGYVRPMFEVLDQPGMVDGLVLDRWCVRFTNIPDEPEAGS